MNRLKPEKETLVLKMLVEGNSIRGIARMTGIDIKHRFLIADDDLIPASNRKRPEKKNVI